MGMYDIIYCDFELPDIEVQKEKFQTKCFGQNLDTYRILKDGTFRIEAGNFEGDVKINRNFNFYTSISSYTKNTYRWYEYEAVVENGKIIKIIKKYEIHNNA